MNNLKNLNITEIHKKIKELPIQERGEYIQELRRRSSPEIQRRERNTSTSL